MDTKYFERFRIVMAFTFDNSSTDPTILAISDVRLLIKDINPDKVMFQDSDMLAYLRLAGGMAKPGAKFRAAALALITTAGDDARLQKRIETLGLKIDGPALAKELRENAKELKASAREEIAEAAAEALAAVEADDEDDLFDFACLS